ncbi:DUF1330 domain-containing protein [Candidatus Puniceispirillum sp.]|nr:DUF1330 domain-containing protein [Candidatus Puniceispirillum sp.]
MEKFVGTYLTRGGKTDIVQNELWGPTRIVLIQFPPKDSIYNFLDSPEYAPVKDVRLVNSKATTLVLEGI